MGRVAATLLSLAVLASARVHAQDHPSWGVLVVTSAADPANDVAVADAAYAQLVATGHALIADERLSATLDGTLSAPPHDAPHALVARLASGTSDVVHQVAAGHDGPAIDGGRALLTEAEANLPALGRDESSAENVRNLCLFLVRAYADQHRRDEARTMALECVRLAPDLTQPSAHWHPPDIVAIFQEARATLAAPGHATLAVQTEPGDPAGCVVRDDGRPMGTAPISFAVAPGVHQVQVECRENRPSRVHRVTVAAGGTTHAVITARFDEALRGTPRVSLVYDDENALGRYLAEDVARIGRTASLAHLLVIHDDHGRVFLKHFLVPDSGAARVAGLSLVERPTDPDLLRTSIEAVTSSATVEAETATPTVPPPSTPPPVPSGEHPPTTFGVVLAITGAAGIAGGWGFWAWLQQASRDFNAAPTTPDFMARYFDLQRQMDGSAVGTIASGIAGGVALTLSLPWLLPDENGVPWWGWLSGALGLTATGAAVAFAAIPPPCLSSCARHEQNGATVAIFASMAVPLIAVPIVYLVRGSHPAEPSVRVTASFGQLAVSGTW